MSAHVTPVRTYVAVFVALVILTWVTYYAATFDFGWVNTPIALAIAISKASLVVVFFMGLRYNSGLTKLAAVAGLFWLLIMFGITMSDYMTRGWMGVPGR
jgi:cytochrome c oxidase subunit 4